MSLRRLLPPTVLAGTSPSPATKERLEGKVARRRAPARPREGRGSRVHGSSHKPQATSHTPVFATREVQNAGGSIKWLSPRKAKRPGGVRLRNEGGRGVGDTNNGLAAAAIATRLVCSPTLRRFARKIVGNEPPSTSLRSPTSPARGGRSRTDKVKHD